MQDYRWPQPTGASCIQEFEDSLFLRFTEHIAFRNALHRFGNQDIHWQQLFVVVLWFVVLVIFFEKGCLKVFLWF